MLYVDSVALVENSRFQYNSTIKPVVVFLKPYKIIFSNFEYLYS